MQRNNFTKPILKLIEILKIHQYIFKIKYREQTYCEIYG